jgi:hypothetical protein
MIMFVPLWKWRRLKLFKKLGNGIKEFFLLTWWLWMIAIFVYSGIQWDIYRWHTFQETTHSNIGFWKWNMLYGGHR